MRREATSAGYNATDFQSKLQSFSTVGNQTTFFHCELGWNENPELPSQLPRLVFCKYLLIFNLTKDIIRPIYLYFLNLQVLSTVGSNQAHLQDGWYKFTQSFATRPRIASLQVGPGNLPELLQNSKRQRSVSVEETADLESGLCGTIIPVFLTMNHKILGNFQT